MKQLKHFNKKKPQKTKKKKPIQKQKQKSTNKQTNLKNGRSLTGFIFIIERRVSNESDKVKIIEIHNLPHQVTVCIDDPLWYSIDCKQSRI